jgi:hypothetical protein
LLRPIATPETVTLHPRRQLETLCSKQGLEMNLQSFQSEETVEARVYINEVLVASSRHHESTVARRLAAFKVRFGHLQYENVVIILTFCEKGMQFGDSVCYPLCRVQY